MTSFSCPVPVSQEHMDAIYHLCKANEWAEVLYAIRTNPTVAVSSMKMSNNISTTVLHQVLSSRSDDYTGRRDLVFGVLDLVGHEAAMISNGYGSLPLHVILQRNTKMISSIRESLAFALVQANPKALLSADGPGKRTPLHIVFTDYFSPQLIQFMIQQCPKATTMRDKEGNLPIHLACRRHCSKEKLQMLLNAYPESISEVTKNGETPLELAVKSATSAHPNNTLIKRLQQETQKAEGFTSAAFAATTTPPGGSRATRGTKHTGMSHCKQTHHSRLGQVQPTSDFDSIAVDLLMHFHNASQESPTPRQTAEV